MKKIKKLKKKEAKKGLSFYDRYKDKIVSAPEYKDSVKYIRQQREKSKFS